MPRTRTIFVLAAALLLAALLLPFAINVNRYRSQIARELQARLGRRVEVGSLRLKILSGPGFDLRNVVIGEDPAFGVEPFVRVATLRATLRLRSLWTGRLGFSSLVFVAPSVNLGRGPEGRWNIESIVRRGSASGGVGAALSGVAQRGDQPLPYVELQDARINFKTGDTKSVFFLSGVDAALYATPGSRRWNLRFTGAPARTDRTLTDIGRLRVEGSFPAETSREPIQGMRLNVDLRDAYLADLLMLTSWNNQSVHGVVQLRAVVENEADALRATGTALISDLHRWDLLPPEDMPALEVRFDSTVDLPAGSILVRNLRAPLGAGMLEGTGTITQLLRRPSARFRLNFSGARAASALAALAHFSSRVPPGTRLDGTLDGTIEVEALPLRIEGFVAGRGLALRASGISRAVFEEARVDLHGSSARLARAALLLPGGRRINLAGWWDWELRRGGISAAGQDLPLPTLAALSSAAGLAPVPGSLAPLPETRVSLDVETELARGLSPRLTGWAQLSRARWTPANLPSPVTIHAARLDFTADQVRATRVVASWAGGTITGAARIPLRTPAVYWADLKVTEWNSGALALALRGRSRALLLPPTPAVRGESSAPPAPETGGFRAEGRLAIGRLLLRRIELDDVQTAFRLSGRRVELDRTRARFGGGEWEGTGKLDFSSGSPNIEVRGRLRGFSLARVAELAPAFSGLAEGAGEASLSLVSSGWETPELLRNLSMKAQLEARDLLLRNVDLQAAAAGAPSSGISRLSVCTVVLAVAQRRVRIERLGLQTAAGARFTAEGAVDFDRTADIRVSPAESQANRGAALRAFRLVGPLDSPHTVAIEPGEKKGVRF